MIATVLSHILAWWVLISIPVGIFAFGAFVVAGRSDDYRQDAEW